MFENISFQANNCEITLAAGQPVSSLQAAPLSRQPSPQAAPLSRHPSPRAAPPVSSLQAAPLSKPPSKQAAPPVSSLQAAPLSKPPSPQAAPTVLSSSQLCSFPVEPASCVVLSGPPSIPHQTVDDIDSEAGPSGGQTALDVECWSDPDDETVTPTQVYLYILLLIQAVSSYCFAFLQRNFCVIAATKNDEAHSCQVEQNWCCSVASGNIFFI